VPSQHLRQAFFLIFPELILFYKMGIIMMSTVVVSLLWAMCFFTSLLAAIGPENDTGDLSKYVMLLPCCKGKENVKENKAGVELQVKTEEKEEYQE